MRDDPITAGSRMAFFRYSKMLKDLGAEPINNTEFEGGDTTSLNHLLWMCEYCMENISAGAGMSVDKYSRWLGYIQGVMICKGITTVETERNITRPWFKKLA